MYYNEWVVLTCFSTRSHIASRAGEGEHGTNQRDSQGEEPGVDEKVVAPNLDDVQEQWGHRQQDALGHSELLHSVSEEEPQRLRGRADINMNKNRQREGSVFVVITDGSLGFKGGYILSLQL